MPALEMFGLTPKLILLLELGSKMCMGGMCAMLVSYVHILNLN